MTEIIDINRRRRPEPKVPPKSLLDAQIQFLAEECASRAELLEGLAGVFAKLAEIVPPARRAELSHALCYIGHELDLTAANLRVVLICAMVLFDKYTAERGVSEVDQVRRGRTVKD